MVVSYLKDNNVVFIFLDWEIDEVMFFFLIDLLDIVGRKSFDVIIVCDCIYNEVFIDLFVFICVDICWLRI